MTFQPSKLLAAATLLTAAAPATVWAQKTGGKIEDAEIEIVKERVNELPEATRNFEKVKLEGPVKVEKKVTYTFPDFRLPADKLNPSVRVLTIRQEDLAPLTGNYLKGGLGNYGTVYGKAYLHNNRSDRASYGLDFSHLSSSKGPVDKKNSSQSQTSLALNGETYGGPLVLGATASAGRERYNFYGYDQEFNLPPSPDSLKQVFTRAAVKLYARNRATDAAFQYDFGVGFNFWKDRFRAKESNVYATLRSGYKINETSRIRFDGDVSFINFRDSLSYSRPLVQVTPAYELTLNRLAVSVGATLAYTGDTIGKAKQANFYPAVRLGYTVTEDKFLVFAGLGGALQRVTMYDLTTENPWLAPNQRVADTHRGPTLYFGFQAAPARSLEVNAKVTLSNDQNLYFYANSPRDTTKFNLVYDQKSTQLLNVHGEVIYNAAEKTRVGFKADYNGYKVHSLPEAFHRPAFQGTLFGTYNVYDKLLLGAEIYTYSSSFGRGYRRQEIPSVPPGPSPATYAAVVRPTDSVIDLNLRADYRIMENLSIFALGNNLLGRKNERFLNYPVKGINVLAGVTYDF
ncbi:hypothetical protein HMJ29_17475 [Hymenobacter taeanensis]|uniref:TonB-dependent receptor n=1 Tax=Hymenobacter taeanensis TaxID=2735321 RepID=A0A6M6BJ88_9BACT|nr:MULTISPECIES: hypothetical protein [Hymenobacter]QJX48611.1 hypothetical protein HMJ29_17475 [Hymenobacter taeanensis]UOQ81890.1 hypothetical protein MUN83_03615 [Hymenobacter sp. 5414T-23]